MKSLFTLFLTILFASLFGQQKAIFPASLMLVPEKSNFEKTSAYADVQAFLNEIQILSPYVHLDKMGKSPMGLDIPVAILAKPAVSNPEQARASGKPVI